MLRKMLPRLGALMIVLLGLLPGSPALADSSTVPGTTLQGLTLETLDDGLTLHVSTPVYRLQNVQRDGQTFQEIALDDENWWPVGDAGSPQLPERSVLLAVPPAGQVIVESVETGDAAVVSGVTLQPAPDVTLVDDALQSSWTVNRAAYASDAWQPARAAEITEEGWLRGVRFVRLALRPFQINPAQGSLRVSDSVTVRLRFEQSGNATPAPADPLYAGIPFDIRQLLSGGSVADRADCRGTPAAARRSLGQGDRQSRRAVPCYLQRPAGQRTVSSHNRNHQSLYHEAAG